MGKESVHQEIYPEMKKNPKSIYRQQTTRAYVPTTSKRKKTPLLNMKSIEQLYKETKERYSDKEHMEVCIIGASADGLYRTIKNFGTADIEYGKQYQSGVGDFDVTKQKFYHVDIVVRYR